MLEITIAGKIIRIGNYIWTKSAKYINKKLIMTVTHCTVSQ